MNDWKELVRWAGQSATKNHAAVQVIITDCIDLDDTYHLEMGGYCGSGALRARTQRGVDCLLQEFGIPGGEWREREGTK